jgi:hypothetical protein
MHSRNKRRGFKKGKTKSTSLQHTTIKRTLWTWIEEYTGLEVGRDGIPVPFEMA